MKYANTSLVKDLMNDTVVIVNGKSKNTFTVINLGEKENQEYVRFLFTEEELRSILKGKTIKNCKKIGKMKNDDFSIIEDCLNNDGNNYDAKSFSVHKMFINYRIYKCGKHKIRIRNRGE